MKHQTKQLMVVLVVVAIVLVAGIAAARYTAVFQRLPDAQTFVNSTTEAINNTGQSSYTPPAEPPRTVEYTVEKVATELFVPWSIVFTSNTRMLVTERNGNLRVIENGVLKPEPLYVFANVSQQSEEGLMGLAKDPNYATNKYMYACVAIGSGSDIRDQIVRFVDEGDRVSNVQVIFDDIPAAKYHAGCRIAFGPDKKLYVTTGDARERDKAQDRGVLNGKILRLEADGSIPADNPFEDSPVYSYGHRNPQGITWHPESGAMLETEHGPSINDGPAGGDEINTIESGKNYGWPVVHHDESRDGMVSPLRQFTPAVAPGSALVYSGKVFGQWKHRLFFGGLKGEGLYVVTFTDSTASTIASYEKLPIAVGRVRDIVEAPDGSIYFTTSNRDGRGKVQNGDDYVYRIAPKQ